MTIHHLHPLPHALACVALTAGVSVCCVVAQARDVPERAVRYERTDLATEAGAQKLYGQLQIASREICDEMLGSHRKHTHQYQVCYSKVLADAVGKVDRQTLTSLHDRLDAKSARTHRSRAGKSAS